MTAEQLRALKKGNASVNAEKSRIRIPDAFKKATTAQKKEITELSGLSKFTYYSASKNGSASPKAVIALSQIMNISPLYLIGEIDKKEPCDAAALAEFFKRSSTGKSKAMPAPAPAPVPAKAKAKASPKKPSVVKIAAEPVKPAVTTKAPIIDEESLLLLVRALLIRAKLSDEAQETYNKVVALLAK
ncbi:MAG: hypothetical protein FWG70_10830 [Oscillospiraceae bacterium]|nr:hypothetical protein [Oscillospiraceae bacterium]